MNRFIHTLKFQLLGSILLLIVINPLNFGQSEEWIVFDSLNSPLEDNIVLTLKHDKNDNIWIGTYYGLLKYDGYFWSFYNTSNSSLPSDTVYTLVNDKHNNLWFIVSADNFPYFLKFDGNNWIKTDTSQSCLEMIYNKYSFAVDGNEVKWVAGRKVGEGIRIIRISEVSCTSFSTELNETNTTDLTVDHNNHFWFSVDWWDPNTGVAKFDYSQWIYSHRWSVGLAVDTIYNEAWYSSAGSVNKLDFHNLNWLAWYNLPWPQYNVWKIYPDKNYNLWCRSTAYGIFKFDRATTDYTHYNESNSGLPSDTVRSITIDDSSNVWLATSNGLAVLNESGINFLPSISSKDTLDFGEVLLNDTLSQSFIISNPLQTEIIIDSIISISTVFNYNGSLPITIEPGNSEEFAVSFTPDSLIEYKFKLTLHTNKGMKSILLTGVGDDPSFVYYNGKGLNEYQLSQNYPNPFNPSTTISYQIPESSIVTLKVYDVLGNEVTTIVNEEKPAGSYKVEFNGSDLSSGIYFYRMRASNFIDTKKIILLK